MTREDAINSLWNCVLAYPMQCGNQRALATEIMAAAFPDYDWRLAVELNEVCPECEGTGNLSIYGPEGEFYECDPCPTCYTLGSVPKKEGGDA